MQPQGPAYQPMRQYVPQNYWHPQPLIHPAAAGVGYPQMPRPGSLILPHSPVIGDLRLGDTWDRRRTFGNVYRQPFMPPVPLPHAGFMDVGQHWDRTQVFGNSFQQPFLQDGLPWGQYYAPPRGSPLVGSPTVGVPSFQAAVAAMPASPTVPK